MHRQRGFTLFELIITMAIAAIVIGIAAPGFSSMVQNNRLSSQSLDFITALNLARSEAIKRSTQITLCKSNNGKDCVADAGATGWEQGWIVFVDNSNPLNNIRDPGDPVLRVHNLLSGSNTLTGNANVANFIAYTPRGNTTQLGTLALCDPRSDDDKSKAIIINSTGRARIAKVSQSTMTCP